MTPERERDRRLAEWMGCTTEQDGRIVWMPDNATGWQALPAFHLDIAAAFEVVEFVLANCAASCDLSAHGCDRWCAYFRMADERLLYGRATSAPEAICRAAVAVMEAEQRKEGGA